MYRRDGHISLYLFQTRNMEVENGARLFTILLEAAPLSRHITVNPEEKGAVRRFRIVRLLKERKTEAGRGLMASFRCPSYPASSSFMDPSPTSSTSVSTFSPTTALTTSRRQDPGPAAAFPPLGVLPRASVPPLAHLPFGLDASTLAAQDEASFAVHDLASRSTATIFPPHPHTFHGALAPAPSPFPPPDLLSAAKVEPVSLAVEKQQQEFARRARKAEMRRRRRLSIKQQQQEQKERGKACSSAFPFPLERTELLSMPPLPSPLPSFPPLAPRGGGLAARRAASLQSHRSPISELGHVPVLDEIPGALAVFEKEEG
jgi:hypothetical protein